MTAERASLEERMARVEGILEEVRTRLNHLETRFNWLLGIVITMWVTVMAGIFGIIAAIFLRS